MRLSGSQGRESYPAAEPVPTGPLTSAAPERGPASFGAVLLNFVFATSTHLTGGVTMLFEFADAMARRGHDVHFVHGPATTTRVARFEDVPFDFDPRVTQHIVDSLDDPSIPAA